MTTDLGWWFIHGDEIMDALKAVAEGQDPEFVYLEMYANSYREGEFDATEE